VHITQKQIHEKVRRHITPTYTQIKKICEPVSRNFRFNLKFWRFYDSTFVEYIGPKFRYHISKFFVELITSFHLAVFLTKSDQLNFSRNLKNQLPVSPNCNFLEFCA
jgi:hypothetical protein